MLVLLLLLGDHAGKDCNMAFILFADAIRTTREGGRYLHGPPLPCKAAGVRCAVFPASANKGKRCMGTHALHARTHQSCHVLAYRGDGA